MSRNESKKKLERILYVCGHTKKSFSELCGLSYPTISRAFDGYYLPAPATVAIMAEALDMDARELRVIFFDAQSA